MPLAGCIGRQKVVVVYVPTRKSGSDAISTAIVQETSALYKQILVVNEILGLMEKIITTYLSVVSRTDDKVAANCPRTHKNPRAEQR